MSVSTSSASVSRARVSLLLRTGEAPAGAPDDVEEARMDEEMTDLLSFLGGSEAT